MNILDTSTQAIESTSDNVELHSLCESDIQIRNNLVSDRDNSTQSKVSQNKQNQQNYQNN